MWLRKDIRLVYWFEIFWTSPDIKFVGQQIIIIRACLNFLIFSGVVFLFGDSLFGADVSGSGYGAPAVGYGAPEGTQQDQLPAMFTIALMTPCSKQTIWTGLMADIITLSRSGLNYTKPDSKRLIIAAAYGAPAPSYSAPAPSYAAAPATGYDAANRYYVSCQKQEVVGDNSDVDDEKWGCQK